MMVMLRAAQMVIVGCLALGSAVSFARADDRAICASVPPKPDALPACSRIIASPRTSDHDRAMAFGFRAEAKRAHDDVAGALADYGQALTLLPNYSLALDNRGALLLKRGDFAQAIADFDAALRVDPKDARALYQRGVAKRGSGDASGGDADIAAAEALNPGVADRL